VAILVPDKKEILVIGYDIFNGTGYFTFHLRPFPPGYGGASHIELVNALVIQSDENPVVPPPVKIHDGKTVRGRDGEPSGISFGRLAVGPEKIKMRVGIEKV